MQEQTALNLWRLSERERKLVQALRYLWNLRDRYAGAMFVRISYTERRKVRGILGRELSDLIDAD